VSSFVLSLPVTTYTAALAAKPDKPQTGGDSGAGSNGNGQAPDNGNAGSNGNGKAPDKGKPARNCLDGSESNGNGNSAVCTDLPALQSLTARQAGPASVELSFQYAGPAEVAVKFQIERDGQSIGSTFAQSFTDSGVAPGAHVYRVRPHGKSGKGRETVIHNGPFAQASVKVGQQACAAAPALSLSVTPNQVWSPNKKMVPVTISGTVIQGEGCSLIGATYTVNDEYGQNQSGSLMIGASGGSFSQAIQVEAWRQGNDFDGRLYTITVSALNSIGEATKSVEVLVPHDQR